MVKWSRGSRCGIRLKFQLFVKELIHQSEGSMSDEWSKVWTTMMG